MIDQSRLLSTLRFAGAGLCLSLICAPAFAANKADKPEIPDGEKIVCKRIGETGSLVKKQKICLTRDQWARSAEKHEGYARELADGLRTKPAGN